MAVRFNKGDISEAILCAAIAAKFKKRLSARQLSKDPIISIGDLPPINYQEVKSILTDMVGSGFRSNYSVRDRDIATKQVSKITDNISVSVGLPQPSAQFLSNSANWGSLFDIFNAAVNKVNSDTAIKQKVFRTQFNLKQDSITINGIGTRNQRSTKVDIRLDISTGGVMAPRTSSQISLKYEAPQFAQAVGLQFDRFANIFEPLGIANYTADEAEFNKAIFGSFPNILSKRFDSRASIMESNEVKALKSQASKIFQGRILSQLTNLLQQPGFKQTLANYVKSKATLDESGVELVKFLKDGTSVTQKFDEEFTNNIVSSEWEAEYTFSDNPTIIVFKKGGNRRSEKLLQFRYRADARLNKSDNTYNILMRTYVESGPLIYTL